MGNSFVKYLRNKAGASLEGFSVKSLLYWASCFKSVTHPLFDSFLVVLLYQWNTVLIRSYFTVHHCLQLDGTIKSALTGYICFLILPCTVLQSLLPKKSFYFYGKCEQTECSHRFTSRAGVSYLWYFEEN